MAMIVGSGFVFVVTSLILSMLVTFASCVCEAPCCEHPCSPILPGADRCETRASNVCGRVPVRSGPPSAPTGLMITNFVHPYGGTATLGLKITWHLPENVTGLSGFLVHVIKTSYVVGFQNCKRVNIPPLTETPNNPSEVIFSLDCLKAIDVDGKYDITVTSLDSGQSISQSHRAKTCLEVPEVGGCRNCSGEDCEALASPNDWRPPSPTADASFDGQVWIVRVSFHIYPGDLWLQYRVNLYSYELDRVPDKLSQMVYSNGRRGVMDYKFRDVKPGSYVAKVKIFPGDTRQVNSNVVNVSAVSPVSMTTEAQDTSSKSLATTPKAAKPKPGLMIKDIPTTVGVVVSVLVAVLLLVGLVVWGVRKKRQSAGYRDSPGDYSDTSHLANNMLHGEDKVVKDGHRQVTYMEPNHYEWTEGNGGDLCSGDYASQFDVGPKPIVRKLEDIDDFEPSELVSIAARSGESV